MAVQYVWFEAESVTGLEALTPLAYFGTLFWEGTYSDITGRVGHGSGGFNVVGQEYVALFADPSYTNGSKMTIEYSANNFPPTTIGAASGTFAGIDPF